MEESFHNFELPAAAGRVVVTLVTSPALSELTITIIDLLSLQSSLATAVFSSNALQHCSTMPELEAKWLQECKILKTSQFSLQHFLCILRRFDLPSSVTLNPLYIMCAINCTFSVVCINSYFCRQPFNFQ